MHDERISPYIALTDRQLRSQHEIIIVESPKVIKVALEAGCEPLSMLCEKRHITGDAHPIINRCPDEMPVYTGERELLSSITGYTLTRGVLCAMRRPKSLNILDITENAQRVAVIHGVCDTTNIGAIFRSAAALNIDAVLLTDDSCDPYNRRSIRTSMGSVFLVPWCWLPSGTNAIFTLQRLGFTSIAMALREDAISLADNRLKNIPKVAIVVGTEGDGLARDVIEASDLRVVIPMHNNVDSLNVAAASAIAFWELGNNINYKKDGHSPK